MENFKQTGVVQYQICLCQVRNKKKLIFLSHRHRLSMALILPLLYNKEKYFFHMNGHT